MYQIDMRGQVFEVEGDYLEIRDGMLLVCSFNGRATRPIHAFPLMNVSYAVKKTSSVR